MGCAFGMKTCMTGSGLPPNPNPHRWKIERMAVFDKGYVLCVHYLDCINLEGLKIMVYEGKMPEKITSLDPHFQKSKLSPIARFYPDERGWDMACSLAKNL